MTDTLPSLHPTIAPDRPRQRALSGFGHLLVAAIYALMLLAAPAIVRYAPAPSATPIAAATAPFVPHVDCTMHAAGGACAPAPAR